MKNASIIYASLLCALLAALSVTEAPAFEGDVDTRGQKQSFVEIYLDRQDGPAEPPRNAPLPPAAPGRLLQPFFTAHAYVRELQAQVQPPAPAREAPHSAAVPGHEDMTIPFEKSSSQMSPAAEKNLASIAAQMNELPDMRLQIRAYASDGDGGPSSARRMSLSRGLMVRSYLTEKGIKPVRLDVRALGAETEKTPADRVDLVFVR